MSDFDQRTVVAMLGAAQSAPAAVDAIQKHGLASLLDGTPLTVAEIASLSGLSGSDIAAGIQALVDAGRVDLDGDRIVGVGGLTLISTAHSLQLPNAEMHTWCALDAVGIPVALGLKATVETRCPQCDDHITVQVNEGTAAAAGPITLFCPTGQCDNVRADFCSAANLFCSPTHLRQWRADNPSAMGENLDLLATADLGQAMWGRYHDAPKEHNANE